MTSQPTYGAPEHGQAATLTRKRLASLIRIKRAALLKPPPPSPRPLRSSRALSTRVHKPGTEVASTIQYRLPREPSCQGEVSAPDAREKLQ